MYCLISSPFELLYYLPPFFICCGCNGNWVCWLSCCWRHHPPGAIASVTSLSWPVTLIGRRAAGGDIPVVLKIMRVHREFVCFAYHPLNWLYTFCSYLFVLDCSVVDERMVVEVEGTWLFIFFRWNHPPMDLMTQHYRRITAAEKMLNTEELTRLYVQQNATSRQDDDKTTVITMC